MQQILAAGKKQLSQEDYEKLVSLIVDLQVYGLTPWINAELGKIMAGLQWELEIGESPEWEEALVACDRAFLGRELRDMCWEAGVSPDGHKKQLCARLYEAEVEEVVEIMQPIIEGAKERVPQALPQTIPLYRTPLAVAEDRLEELRRSDPEEFYERRKIIKGAIEERKKGKTKTMRQFNLEELQELLRFTDMLYR
jgi:hypothetical protein